MSVIVMILLKDGLQQPSGSVAEASYHHLIYCRVPETWLDGPIPESDELWIKGPSLNDASTETVLETLYGADWRRGNDDGSQYVVLALGSRILNPARESEKPWQHDDPSNTAMRLLHYVAREDGRLQRVLPSGL